MQLSIYKHLDGLMFNMLHIYVADSNWNLTVAYTFNKTQPMRAATMLSIKSTLKLSCGICEFSHGYLVK